MRERWLSRRAVALHVAAVVLTLGCAVAASWQITRAQDGNQLSYFYSVMWPVFGVLVVCFWWLLVHTDYEKVGLKGVRSQAASPVPPEPVAEEPARPATAAAPESAHAEATDDPELASYNARLAALASTGPKTWRHRDPVVVRRSR